MSARSENLRWLARKCDAVDRRAAVGVVLRDVRRAAAFATASDEVSRIIVLVATHGASGFGVVLDHVERGRALGRAVSLRQPGIDDKPIAVLHHQMPHVTELGLLAGTLSKQPSVGVGGRGMRVILGFLAMEVAFDIAPATAVLTFPWRGTFSHALAVNSALDPVAGLLILG